MAGVGAIVATVLALIGFAFAAWSERIGTARSEGVVALAVAPWGEVYVDGAARGTAPPLRQLTLPAGRHTIEVRNGDRQPYVAQVDVAPDRPQRIAHRFQ